MYLLEFAGGFVIQVVESYANSLNKFIRAYLSKHFNALQKSMLHKGLCAGMAEPEGRIWQQSCLYLRYLLLSTTVCHTNV